MEKTIDVVAWPLDKAIKELKNIGYECTFEEIPIIIKRQDVISSYEKYVVRQELVSDSKIFKLLVCSKCRKEVQ